MAAMQQDLATEKCGKTLDDRAGDGFFVDVTSPDPLVFYHMLEVPGPTYYGTFAEFATFIADGFDSGVLFVNASGKFDYDEARYEAHEAAHLATATKP